MGPAAGRHPRFPRHGACRLTVPPRYGYDAPGTMRGLILGGGGIVAAAWALGAGLQVQDWALAACILSGAAGAVLLGLGLSMAAYGRWGKLRMRDRMLGLVPWTGRERVLDVGTGAGLLLVGAAQRALNGHAVGIDIWSAKDLSGNGPEVAGRNARLEGVASRVEVLTADARRVPFADDSFDRVLSLLCVHNIEGKAEQDAACREIARVLRPGGTALVADWLPTHGYAAAFRAAGLTTGASEPYWRTALGLMWLVRADKPGRAPS